MMEQLEKYRNTLCTIIRRYLPTCRIILFGSRARGTQSPGSDFDIALDQGKAIDLLILSKIRDEFQECSVPLYVDFVDVHTASSELKEEIDKEGIEWIC